VGAVSSNGNSGEGQSLEALRSQKETVRLYLFFLNVYSFVSRPSLLPQSRLDPREALVSIPERRSWPAVWLRSGSRAPAWRRRRESCSNQILLFSSVSVCPSNSPAHEYHTSIIVRTQVKKELKSFDASFHKFYGRQPRHEPALAPSPLPFLAPQGAEL
jgi:hypothetical protein